MGDIPRKKNKQGLGDGICIVVDGQKGFVIRTMKNNSGGNYELGDTCVVAAPKVCHAFRRECRFRL